ncbi:cell differentiation family, Rcd1-like-domain-containing protein [Phakopsora pachyrhizi]|uniref:Cell differentiation family, Rcd1-like-domain-containing protein n=1 Tax=Phakopsora pachyrhizi TaxID=170000 RepID=A0AAV0BJG7_PHAPC|nr:cell differentiation family, Rcd1-like-domain-containing protein [Phakopsora pachyrhizi]CAH7686122.1 cell differentiation family, Rcd1-like-domain-containing protein [Phakopsora pachyrhizi]
MIHAFQPQQQQPSQSYFRPSTPSNSTSQHQPQPPPGVAPHPTTSNNPNHRLLGNTAPSSNQSSHNLNNLHLNSLIGSTNNSNSHQQRNLLLGALNSPLLPLSTPREAQNPSVRSETPSLIGPSLNTPTSAGLPLSMTQGNGLGSNPGGKYLLTQKSSLPDSPTPNDHPGSTGNTTAVNQAENEKIYYLIVDLLNPTTREMALLELSKKREQWDDLALVLWHSFGVMSCLLQEIVTVYPLLSPPSLTANASNRVCNALALLQCVASHQETRALFLQAHLPLFLYPFLNTTSKTRPFEYLRLTSLGVIGALVKQNDNLEVINFLLSTEIIPLCLRIMETGSELSKTVAIFIVQKILLDEMGLAYICQTYERFYAVGTVLSNMVTQLVENQAVRLLKHVVRCYLRLSDNLRAREALRACLPEPLRDATFSQVLKGDLVTKRCLASLLLNLSDRVE